MVAIRVGVHYRFNDVMIERRDLGAGSGKIEALPVMDAQFDQLNKLAF
jgi:hypothetical protein